MSNPDTIALCVSDLLHSDRVDSPAQMRDCIRAVCARLEALAPTEAAAMAATVPAEMYVEARQCSSCGHIGINDSSDTDSACNSCDWTGPNPGKDHCPECDNDGTMTSACPECGGRYEFLCDAQLPNKAPVAGQPAESSSADLQARIEALEAELDEARQEPWPEWAERMKKTIRKYSGYDGFDDASEGIDLPEELDELLSTQPGAHVIEAVATIGLKDGEPCIEWLLEGGIYAMEGHGTLLASTSKLTNDEGYGEVYLMPPAPKGDSNG